MLTENWKPAGTGGHASRGWAVVVRQPRIVAGLLETFRADAGWRDARSWERVRAGKSFPPPRASPAADDYPARFEPQAFAVGGVELVRAPDDAERRVVALLDDATESIRVEQMEAGGPNQPFVRAALRAARRGVDVRILLSSAWYVREDNRAVVQWLNRRADREDLPLSARLADPNGRFEKIHAKGVIVDGDQVLVGSLNWNNNSARHDREVALLLDGEGVAGYYARVFCADWQGGIWRLTVGVAFVAAVTALAAALVGRRISFEDERATGVGPGRR
ncbi:MAG: phospholipase D-like domain-containing protein [Haloarculaceae archaeon]